MLDINNEKDLLELKEKVIDRIINNDRVDMVYKGDIIKFVNSEYYNVLLYRLFKAILINVLDMDKSSTDDDICSYIKTYKSEILLRDNIDIDFVIKPMLDIDKIVYNNSISIIDFYLLLDEVLHINHNDVELRQYNNDPSIYILGLVMSNQKGVHAMYLKIKLEEEEMKVENEETMVEKELIKERDEIEKELEEVNKRKEVIYNNIMKHNISFLQDEFKSVSKSENISLNKLKSLETKYNEEKSKFDKIADEKASIIKKIADEYPNYYTRDISKLTKEELLLEEKILELCKNYVYENMFKPHFNTPYGSMQYPQHMMHQNMSSLQQQEYLRRQQIFQNRQSGCQQQQPMYQQQSGFQQQQPMYQQRQPGYATPEYRSNSGAQQNTDTYSTSGDKETIIKEIIDQLEIVRDNINKKSRKPRNSKSKQASKK